MNLTGNNVPGSRESQFWLSTPFGVFLDSPALSVHILVAIIKVSCKHNAAFECVLLNVHYAFHAHGDGLTG